MVSSSCVCKTRAQSPQFASAFSCWWSRLRIHRVIRARWRHEEVASFAQHWWFCWSGCSLSMNIFLEIAIRLLISASHFPLDVSTLPRYSKLLLCWRTSSSKTISHFGFTLFFENTITLVFFLLMNSPRFSLSSFKFASRCSRLLLLSASRTVSSAYLTLFTGIPLIFGAPSVVTLRMMISEYSEKRSGDKTHPCLTPLLMPVHCSPYYQWMEMVAICFQYKFRKSRKSLSSTWRVRRSFMISSCFTLSKAFS